MLCLQEAHNLSDRGSQTAVFGPASLNEVPQCISHGAANCSCRSRWPRSRHNLKYHLDVVEFRIRTLPGVYLVRQDGHYGSYHGKATTHLNAHAPIRIDIRGKLGSRNGPFEQMRAHPSYGTPCTRLRQGAICKERQAKVCKACTPLVIDQNVFLGVYVYLHRRKTRDLPL